MDFEKDAFMRPTARGSQDDRIKSISADANEIVFYDEENPDAWIQAHYSLYQFRP